MAIFKNLPALLPLILSQVLTSNAHLSCWMPSMYGLDPTNINSDNASQPLQDYTFDQWWWHGNLDNPPADNESFALPANGAVDVEISSNKAFTTLGRGFHDANPRVAPDPWLNENGWGNMHAPARTDVAGSALAIAYKSDARAVKPEDFVVFSVVHDSPARQLETFHVPDLPACPNNRCMCSWFWIHKSIGGTDQMYMVPFVCHVTGATNTQPLGKPVAPVNCEGNTTKCISGAKSPMYWKNLEGNNMFEPGHYAPTYNTGYGYFEGPQTDIFQDGHNQTSTVKETVASSTAIVPADVTASNVSDVAPSSTQIAVSSAVSTFSTRVKSSSTTAPAVTESASAPAITTTSASASASASASSSASTSAVGRQGHRGLKIWGGW